MLITVTTPIKTLHAAARDPQMGVPPEFVEANNAVEETRQLASDATSARHALIREARAYGIPYPALSRWTGMHVSTLHEIVNPQEYDEPEPEEVPG